MATFERRSRRWAVFAFALACAAYAPTLGHGWAFDDIPEVVSNRSVRSLSLVPHLFTSTSFEGYGWESHVYRPLPQVSFALQFAVSGTTPWSYHLVNVLLHGLASALVFALARSWGVGERASGLAAALFALHPVHVEVVANVAGRKDSLAAVFALAALLAHGRARREGGRFLVLAPLSFLLSCLSKESGAATFGLFVVQDALEARRGAASTTPRRTAFLYASHAVVLVAYLAWRLHVAGHLSSGDIPTIDNPTASAPLVVRWLTAISVLGRGLALIVAPVSLSPDYSQNAIPLVESVASASFLASALALVAIVVVSVKLARRAPVVAASAAFFAVSILPASNLLFPIGTIFGERLLYLPSAGACVVLGLAAEVIAAGIPRRARLALGLGLALLLAARAASYAAVWSNDETLFEHAVRASPDSTKAHEKLADTLLAQGHAVLAIPEYERALAIAPSNTKARLNKGAAEIEAARVDDAARTYHEILSSSNDPRERADALHGLGRIRQILGDLDGATALWLEALAVRPDHAPSLGDLGAAAFTRGDLAEARDLWERATVVAPGSPTAWFNLAQLSEQQGDDARVRAALKRFLEVAGDDLEEQRALARSRLAR